MPNRTNGAGEEESLRQDAADWFSRMRAPDAERDRVAFEAWLTEHPDHRAAYERIARRWQQADLLSHTPSAKARSGLPVRRQLTRAPYAIAASLVAAILIGISTWLWTAPGPGGDVPQSQFAAAEISSPVGIRRVRLSDGSFVTLDTDSSVTVRITEGERRVVLDRGRARFEVAHDAARPFIVSAGDGEVIARGTIFDVSLTEGHPCVSLIKGAVEVRQGPAGAGGKRMVARLEPGQTIVLDGASPAPRAVQAADSAWTSGMLVFEDAPLEQVLATANRYARRKVSIDDPALGALRVTGTFHSDRPDELAATLAQAFGLEVVEREGGLVLRRRKGIAY